MSLKEDIIETVESVLCYPEQMTLRQVYIDNSKNTFTIIFEDCNNDCVIGSIDCLLDIFSEHKLTSITWGNDLLRIGEDELNLKTPPKYICTSSEQRYHSLRYRMFYSLTFSINCDNGSDN